MAVQCKQSSLRSCDTAGRSDVFVASGMAVILAACLIAIAVSLPFDTGVADWVGRTIPIKQIMWLFNAMKAPGHFGFTLVIAGACAAFHPARWRAALFVSTSGIISGVVNSVTKWGVGRTRPLHGVPAFEFHPFRDSWGGLFRAENLSFPSGHTCLAFSTAAALSLLIPRWRSAFFTVACVVALERVLQGSHYLTDVFAAAVFGILSVLPAWWLSTRLWPEIDPTLGDNECACGGAR